MQRLKIAAFSIAFLSLVCQAGCKSGDSDSQKSNSTSIQDVTEAGEEKSTDTTTVDDPERAPKEKHLHRLPMKARTAPLR